MQIRTGRVEAFSDSVISILITVMVFDIKFPDLAHDFTHRDVVQGFHVVGPKLIAYLFAFMVVGILWLNHHHFFHLVQVVDEKLMWLNLIFLFWLSLVPFPTSMIGKNPFLPESAAIFGCVLFMTSFWFSAMRRYAANHHLFERKDDEITEKVEEVSRRVQVKNYVSLCAYALGIPLAYVSVYISFGLFLIPTILFFIPDGVKEASDDVTEEIIDKELA